MGRPRFRGFLRGKSAFGRCDADNGTEGPTDALLLQGMERIPNLAGRAWFRFGDGDHVPLLDGPGARAASEAGTPWRVVPGGTTGPGFIASPRGKK